MIFISWIYKAIMCFFNVACQFALNFQINTCMSVIHFCSDTGMHELNGSFMPFTSYPQLSWAELCSSAKGLLRAMLNSHCAVLLFQDFLSSTCTSLGSMKKGVFPRREWHARPNPPAMIPCQSKSSGRPLAAGTDRGEGLDSREK